MVYSIWDLLNVLKNKKILHDPNKYCIIYLCLFNFNSLHGYKIQNTFQEWII